ncbi:DUF1566 domain-containing protein [Desulfococcaceae bacterium HSG9]|nr:DUF1566 domain-containing protein [Desulfococcaceae bacterium HSG9]
MFLEWFGIKNSSALIGKLWTNLFRRRKKLAQELNTINDMMYHDPLELARYYVEPDCQDYNPADYATEIQLVTKQPIMELVDEFLSKVKLLPGDNQLFVLSDAGMGKTTLLTMLKLAHLTAFWPQHTDCVIKKLGVNTLEELKEIPSRRTTVLLLDSLDEDATAYGRVNERLQEILNATMNFKKVIITCRTQYFPKGDENSFKRPDQIDIGGFLCPVKYLAFFDDHKVETYLAKRFPKKFGLIEDPKKEKAQEIITKMGYLRCRPMLLSYIDMLMELPKVSENESDYHIYDALVESWLKREKFKNNEINTQGLSDACIILATELNTRGVRKIKNEDLDCLIAERGNVKLITKINIKGRSLINRDSEGHWRFSHFSIQEFCVAKLLLDNKVFTPKKPIHVSDLIFKWIAEFKKKPHFCELLDFSDLQMEKSDLSGICLPGANLAGLNFKGADLNNADLSGADLSGADLSGADLRDTNLIGADLKGAKTEGANLEGARPQLLRSKPLTVSKDDYKKTFGLKDNWKPLEYIVNEYEDRGVIVLDRITGLMWQQSGSKKGLTYKEAQAYIEKLNQDRFAGYDDWRLPTIPELISLLESEEQTEGLYINPIFDKKQNWCWSSDTNPIFDKKQKKQNWCWSSDTVKGSSGLAWLVYFNYGDVDYNYLSTTCYVRLVRAGQ